MSDIRIVDHVEQPTAAVRETVAASDLAEFFPRALGAVGTALAEQKLEPAGPPFAKYYGPSTEPFDVEVGFPVETAPQPSGVVVAGILPAGRVVEMIHVGPYDTLGDAYAAVRAFIATEGLVPGEIAWESYLDTPMSTTDVAALRTQLCWVLA